MHAVMQMNILRELLRSFSLAQKQTKKLLIFCGAYMYLIALCSIALCLIAGRWVNYYAAMQWANDLLQSLRPCVGIAALGGLLTEGALHTA